MGDEETKANQGDRDEQYERCDVPNSDIRAGISPHLLAGRARHAHRRDPSGGTPVHSHRFCLRRPLPPHATSCVTVALARRRRVPRFELIEQPADFVFLFQHLEAPVDIVGDELGLGLADRLAAQHFLTQPVETGDVGSIADRELCVAGGVQRARAAMLGDQQVALCTRLAQLLIQFVERVSQRVDLQPLVGHLAGIAFGQLGEALIAFERGARQVVLPLGDRELGLAHPLGRLVFLVLLLLLQQVLIGHRDRHLRLDLQQLVFHVEDDLFDHLLGVFRAVDQIVQVRTDERRDAFEDGHESLLFFFGVKCAPRPRGYTQVHPAHTAAGWSGPGALSPIFLTFESRSDIGMPDSASTSAGTCAAISVRSPVSLCMPVDPPLPVDTIVILSTLEHGAAGARTISGNPVSSLSMTAAWLYSWNASAFTFMARASASPFLKMISASASPCVRVAAAWPSASAVSRPFSASASTAMRCRSTSACFSTVAINSFSRR